MSETVEPNPPSKAPVADRLKATSEVLGLFAAMPARFLDREVTIRFRTGPRFTRASVSECEALRLPIGNTVVGSVKYEPKPAPPGGPTPGIAGLFGGLQQGPPRVYAIDEAGERLLSLPAGHIVVASGVTRFGVWYEVESQLGEDVRVPTPHEGVVIIEVEEVQDAEPVVSH